MDIPSGCVWWLGLIRGLEACVEGRREYACYNAVVASARGISTRHAERRQSAASWQRVRTAKRGLALRALLLLAGLCLHCAPRRVLSVVLPLLGRAAKYPHTLATAFQHQS